MDWEQIKSSIEELITQRLGAFQEQLASQRSKIQELTEQLSFISENAKNSKPKPGLNLNIPGKSPHNVQRPQTSRPRDGHTPGFTPNRPSTSSTSKKKQEDEKQKQEELKRKKAEEMKAKQEEAKRKKAEDEQKKKEAMQKKKEEEAKRKEEIKRKQEEAKEKKKQEEAERKKKQEEAKEKKLKEEAERKKKQEEAKEKKLKEEAERKQKLEEAKKKKEPETKKKEKATKKAQEEKKETPEETKTESQPQTNEVQPEQPQPEQPQPEEPQESKTEQPENGVSEESKEVQNGHQESDEEVPPPSMSLEEIEIQIKSLEENFSEEDLNADKPFEPSMGAKTALSLLNNMEREKFYLDTVPQKEVVKLFKIFYQLQGVTLPKNHEEAWAECQKFLSEALETKDKTIQDIVLERVAQFDFSDENLDKLEAMVHDKQDILDPRYFTAFCAVSGLLAFSVREALVFGGVAKGKVPPFRQYRRLVHKKQQAQ